MKAMFKHDCEDCKFIGSINTVNGSADLYKPCEKSFSKYILRYSDDQADYTTTDNLELYLVDGDKS
jgi:hypothetical protein